MAGGRGGAARHPGRIEVGDSPGEDFSTGNVVKETGGALTEEFQRRRKKRAAIRSQVPAGGNRYRVVPLAELGAAGTGDEREMAIAGRGIAEKPLQIYLARR